jgi:hypothetical protein
VGLLAALALAAPSFAAAPVAADDSDVTTSPLCANNCGIVAWPRGTTDVMGNDTGNAIRVISNTQPAHGSAVCGSLGACNYTGNAGYTGPDEFSYTIRDADGNLASATVKVLVQAPPAGSALIPNDDDTATLAGQPITVNVLANDQGVAPLSVTGVTVNPSHGSVDCSNGTTCTYTPAAGYSGTDGFRYKAHDGGTNEDTADVHVIVVPAGTHYDLLAGGGPLGGGGSIAAGGKGTWALGAKPSADDVALEELAALPLPSLSAQLAGPHSLDAASVKTAKGWTATSLGANATHDALVGDAITEAFPKPLPPISQGTGGDGHVPILAGSKVFAFYHHSPSNPGGPTTAATCLDRRTGTLCAGYPTNGIHVQAISADNNGPGAVVGRRLYTHLMPHTGYSQSAPIGLFCWDVESNDSCGWVMFDRLGQTNNPGGSAPVLVNGKIYMTADTGKLYCYDPSTDDLCGTLDTGLSTAGFAQYDIVTHGSKVFVSRQADKVMCLDVAAKANCSGWSGPVSLGGHYDLINEFNSNGSGQAIGVCAVTSGSGDCVNDDSSNPTHLSSFLNSLEEHYSYTEEAETGTRTFFGSLNRGGLGCWDWTTGAVCAGPKFSSDGWTNTSLPSAYGAVWDGSCAVAVGDPGQVYTVDGQGNSPCLSLSTGTGKRVIDLRDQRCDGGIGNAKWLRVSLSDVDFTPARVPSARVAGELNSVIVTVRDADSGEVLASGDLMQGDHILDLSGIDPAKHPRITLDANASGPSSNVAWDDAIPPRLRLTWKSDPQAMCFTSTTTSQCGQAAGNVSTLGHLANPAEDKRVDVKFDGTAPCVAAQSVKKCGGARLFNIRIRYLGRKIKKLTVTVNGKKQKVVGLRKYRGRPVVRIDLRKLPKTTTVVKITIKTKSGKTLKGKRVYHPCRSKLPDRGFRF